MSIFSNLRKSRQQAKEHNAKLAEQKKKDAQTTPYRHVPTHAAADAIASAPPAWREVDDRPRIVEHNRRRSAMAAAGFSMNMPSTTTIPAMPRVSSSLSYVSYPNNAATPHVGMPRAYSSSSIHHPYGQSRDVVYSIPAASVSQPSSWKGKEVSRNSLSAYDISGGSSTVVSKDPTPEGSSRASNSSHDELEIVTAPARRPKASTTLQVPQPQTQQPQQLQAYHLQQAQQVQQVQQVQAKQIQNVQQAQQAHVQAAVQVPVSVPQASQPVVVVAQQPQVQQAVSDASRPSSSSAHRLHPSHRRTSSEYSERAAGAAPVSAKPGPREARAPPTSMRGFNFIPPATTQQQHPGMGYTGFAPKAPSTPTAAPPASRSISDFGLGNLPIPSPGLDLSGGLAAEASAGQTQYQARMKDNHAPATAARTKQQQQQQPDLEPIVSNGYARHERSQMPPPLAHENLVNIFPEPVPDYDSRSGRGKLSKSKKTRWSFSKGAGITA
ncbi:hypothetical protein PWT90_01137 [Aphanocladium album]|nr:hypothetical protein PWT90_01137 [Aphanocladium album]